MKNLLLIGAGGHAKSVIDLVNFIDYLDIVGIVGTQSERGGKVLGYEVIATDNELEILREKYQYAFISVGQIKTCSIRKKIAKKLINLRFEYPNIISPFSIISSFSDMGFGNFIGHGAILNSSSKIDNHCIINSNALVEHGVVVNSFSHISTGVILNGDVVIGEGSFIGSGSIIREGVNIPPNTIISAGSRIMGWPPSK